MMSKDLSSKNNDKDIILDWRRNPKSIQKYGFVYSFIPNPKEKIKARFLSNKALSLYTLFVFTVLILFRFVPIYAPGILGYASDIHVRELLEYTNKRREDVGLAPLRLDENLSSAAHLKALDMFEKDYWAHVSPDGVQPWDFIINVGYDYSYAGENLAKNFQASKEVVDAWYASESHKENLLSPHYEDIGFAVVNGVLNGYETTLVVQTFGKSRTPTYLGSVDSEPLPERRTEVPAEEAPATTPHDETPAADSLEPAPAAAPTEPSQAFSGGMILDVRSAATLINFGLVTFLSILLMFDVWYSRRKGIRKVSGHAVAHLLFLIFIFVGMWLAFSPGKIL